MEVIIFLIILIFSIILHELAHGLVAYYLGDPTAKLSGRLTLNPIPHIDAMGSIVLPGLLLASGSPFLIGWAKPVPYNPHNFKRFIKYADALVAIAGPAVNILLVFVFAFLFKVTGLFFFAQAVYLNLVLAIFNLIPLPPLDGSKILYSLLPYFAQNKLRNIYSTLEFNPFLGFGIIFALIFVFGNQFFALVRYIASLLLL